MAAAAITPTSVQKTYIPVTKTVGTPIRTVEYLVVLTKVTQADWVVAATYCPGTIIGFDAVTIDSSGNGVQEVMTYTATGTKLNLPSATVGTTYMRVIAQE